ncbi:MAG: hypothetical protein ACP6IY_04445 [Promethearchaeia archaeon]
MEKKIALIVIAIIAGISVPSVYFGINTYIQSQLEKTEVSIKSITLKALSSNEMTVDAEFEVKTAIDTEISYKITDVSITYNDKKLGDASLSKDEFTTSDTTYKCEITISITDTATYNKLIEDFIIKNSISIGIEANVQFTGALESVPQQSISKEVSINALGGLNPTIGQFTLKNMSDDILDFEIPCSFSNPSDIITVLSTLRVDIFYKNEKVGEAINTNDINVNKGINNFNLRANLNGSKNNLIDDFLSNESLEFLTEIYVQMKAGGTLVKILSKTISIKAFGGFTPIFEAFNLVNASGKGLEFKIDTKLNNPTDLQVNFSLLLVNITYKNEVIGNASVKDLNLIAGMNYITLKIYLNGTQNGLTNDFLFQKYVNFTLDCYMRVNPGNELKKVFTKNVSIAAFEGLAPSIDVFQLKNVTGDILNSITKTKFNNPTNLYANFTLILVNITYKGKVIGNASKTNVNIKPGENIIDFLTKLNVSINGLLDDFVQNKTLNFTLDVYMKLDKNGDLVRIFQRNISINGMNGLNPIINDINIINATKNTLLLKINATIDNPSQLTANISKIWIDIYYNKNGKQYYVGNATLENYTLILGTNYMLINATFGGNKTAIEEILSNYIEGKTTNFTLKVNITLSFEKGGNNYTVNTTILFEFHGTTVKLVDVNDVDINIIITYTWLLGVPTAAQIQINTQFTVHNPMDFKINITNFQGKMYFNDTDGYNLFTLSAGQAYNIYIDDVDFSKWNTNPLTLPASGSTQDTTTTTLSNLTLALRLHDECLVHDRLRITIKQGVMDLQIGGFTIQLTDLVIKDIYIPQSSFLYS